MSAQDVQSDGPDGINLQTDEDNLSKGAKRLVETLTSPSIVLPSSLSDIDAPVVQGIESSQFSTHEIQPSPLQMPQDQKFKRFCALTQKLLSYLDFDITELTEVKKHLDDRHDTAMKYNSWANLLVSGSSGILSPAFQYPGQTMSVRVPNTVSIAGAGAASLSSAFALKTAWERGRVQESALLSEVLSKEPHNYMVPPMVIAFLRQCTFDDLGYIGRKLLAIEWDRYKRLHKPCPYNRRTVALFWLKEYWDDKKHFHVTCEQIRKDSKSKLDSDLKTMTSDNISDRITMLTQFRVLVQCALWYGEESSAKPQLVQEESSHTSSRTK